MQPGRSVSANTLTQHGGVIRQVSGRGLFAAYDPKTGTTGSTGNNGGTGQGAGGSGSAGGALSDTGSSPWLPVSGLALLVVVAGAGILRRRHHTAS